MKVSESAWAAWPSTLVRARAKAASSSNQIAE
jgi:hypothetical protein